MLARPPIPRSGYSVLGHRASITMRTLSHHRPATVSWTAVCALCAVAVELLHVAGA